jgi:hypothetical protein
MPADGTHAAHSSAMISAFPASRAARQNLAHFFGLRNAFKVTPILKWVICGRGSRSHNALHIRFAPKADKFTTSPSVRRMSAQSRDVFVAFHAVVHQRTA